MSTVYRGRMDTKKCYDPSSWAHVKRSRPEPDLKGWAEEEEKGNQDRTGAVSQAGTEKGSCQPQPDPRLFRAGLGCSVCGTRPRCLTTGQGTVNQDILELRAGTDLRKR